MDSAHDFAFVIMNAHDHVGTIQLMSAGPPNILKYKQALEIGNMPMTILNEAGQDCSMEYRVVECYFEITDGKVLPIGTRESKEHSALDETPVRTFGCLAAETQVHNVDCFYKKTSDSNYMTSATADCILPSHHDCIGDSNLQNQPEMASFTTYNLTGSSCQHCSPVEKTRRMEIRVEDFRLANAKNNAADRNYHNHGAELYDGTSDRSCAATPILTRSHLNCGHNTAKISNDSQLCCRSRQFRRHKTGECKHFVDILLSKCNDLGQNVSHSRDKRLRLRRNVLTKNYKSHMNLRSSMLPASGSEQRKKRSMGQNMKVKATGRLRHDPNQRNGYKDVLDISVIKDKPRKNKHEIVKLSNKLSFSQLKNDGINKTSGTKLLQTDSVKLKRGQRKCQRTHLSTKKYDDKISGTKLLQTDSVKLKRGQRKCQRTHLSTKKYDDKIVTTTGTGEPEKTEDMMPFEISNGRSLQESVYSHDTAISRSRSSSNPHIGPQVQEQVSCTRLTDWYDSDSSCDVLLLPELSADEFDSRPASDLSSENRLSKQATTAGKDNCFCISKNHKDTEDTLQGLKRQRLEKVQQRLAECTQAVEKTIYYENLKSCQHRLRMEAVLKHENAKLLALAKEVVERSELIESCNAKISARMLHLQGLEASFKTQQTEIDSEWENLSKQKVKLKKEWKMLNDENYRLNTVKRMTKFNFSIKKNLRSQMKLNKKKVGKAQKSTMNIVDTSTHRMSLHVADILSTGISSNMEFAKHVDTFGTENLPIAEVTSHSINSSNALTTTSCSGYYDGNFSCELKEMDQLFSSANRSSGVGISDSLLLATGENFVSNSSEDGLFNGIATVGHSLLLSSDRVEVDVPINSLPASSCSPPVSSTAVVVSTAPLPSKTESVSFELSPSNSASCKLSASCSHLLPFKSTAGQLLLPQSVCMMPSVSLIPVTTPYVSLRCEPTCADDSKKSAAQRPQRMLSRESKSKTRKS